jgi:signal transduction histidine kinase
LVFDLFHRGAGGGRAGLGLAIAKAFVEAHGGHVGVGAARGGGARFVLSLPTGIHLHDGFADQDAVEGKVLS